MTTNLPGKMSFFVILNGIGFGCPKNLAYGMLSKMTIYNIFGGFSRILGSEMTKKEVKWLVGCLVGFGCPRNAIYILLYFLF